MVYNKAWQGFGTATTLQIRQELWDLLEAIDVYCGRKLRIHRLTDKTTRSTSQHYLERAADVHIEDMHVLDQYVLAERFSPGGLGVYPKDVWTHTPGLHIDVRDTSIGRRWAYEGAPNGGRSVVAIDYYFIRHVLSLDWVQI